MPGRRSRASVAGRHEPRAREVGAEGGGVVVDHVLTLEGSDRYPDLMSVSRVETLLTSGYPNSLGNTVRVVDEVRLIGRCCLENLDCRRLSVSRLRRPVAASTHARQVVEGAHIGTSSSRGLSLLAVWPWP